MWKFEKELYDEYKVICGIDEAGRGCLCGNVCAAAVILPPNIELEGVTDSKKLSPKKREELFDIITEKAISYGIGWATPEDPEPHPPYQRGSDQEYEPPAGYAG